jgi:peptidyl-prolyl cis-trans isomerase D
MLNLMRKHAGSWMIKIILFAIVVVFVFWGVGSMRSQQATRVAEINGDIITLEVYRQAYYRLLDNYRRIYGDQFNDDMLKILRPNELALEQLIQRVLMLQEAERLKIDVTDQELAASIREIPAFQNNGTFSYQRYRQVLSQNNLVVEQFESDRINDMRLEKLQTAVMAGMIVSDDEIREWYNWNKAMIDLIYAVFPPSRYKDISPAESEIKAYFDANQKSYLTDPKVKVRYIAFDPAAFTAQISLTDDDIDAYYYGNPEEFRTEKRVKASHILVKVDAGADDALVASKEEEAQKLYALATADGADFADLAKQHSEGPSGKDGGQLGWFTRSQMVQPFAEKAFAMKPGEISAPVKTQFGWHIIKVDGVEEASTKSLESVRESIRKQIIEKESRSLALDKAETVYNSVFDGDNLSDAAAAHDLTALTTDFFTAGGKELKGIGQSQRFAQAAFGLELMAISEIQDLGDKLYILQVSERQEAAVPEYALVMQQVKADLVKERQDEQARSDAEAFLADIKNGGTFDNASSKYDVTPKVTGPFGRGGSIPDIGFESQISQAAFELSEENPLPDSALKGRGGWYVIQFKGRQPPAEEGLEKEKASIARQLESQKKQSAMQAWLADLRARSAVEINRDLIQN